MLDGGYEAWKTAGGAITTGAVTPKAATFKTTERREVLATVDDVLKSLSKKEFSILHTRSRGEYLGTHVRAARGGAIPGAIHIEWTDNLDAGGKFKSNVELKNMYDKAGITPDKEVISYCQGGYRAAHSYVALRLLGFPKVRNYIGSWKEWATAPTCPSKPRKQSSDFDAFQIQNCSIAMSAGFAYTAQLISRHGLEVTLSYSAVSMTWFPVK